MKFIIIVFIKNKILFTYNTNNTFFIFNSKQIKTFYIVLYHLDRLDETTIIDYIKTHSKLIVLILRIDKDFK